jgi:TonB-linked SusC/RagA family outer membrane protein
MTIAVSKTNSKRNNTAAEVIQTSINGVVTDPSGTPISGASITIKGTSRGTSSDDNGTFSIEAHISDIVLISSVGYQSREITITNVNSLTSIILSPQPEELEELIVVGYSTQKKESLTGSLNAIDGEDLRNVTTPNVQNMLNGKAPGVFLAPGSGKPGTPGTVVIRGQATLSGTTNPLWVIDGVIVGSSPGDLNPDDVETLTVLKDAASTAAYGSQGANGVIVVTTKAPRAGEMKINYSTRLGFNDLTNGNLQVMNGAELYDYYSSFANADVISFPRWNDDLRESNFDWWDIATRNGFNQNHNLSLQGGTDKLRSYLSLGYYNEAGAIKGYDYKRYNMRINTIYKPYSWLTIKPTIVGARRGVDDRQYSVTAMYSNLPWDSPFDSNGNLVPHRSSSWVNSASTNYLYDLQWNHGANTNYEFMGNFDFDIKLTDWLTFSSVNNYRYNIYSSNSYTDPRSNGGLNVNGRLTEYRSEYTRRFANQKLDFNKTWGLHNLNGYVFHEFNDYRAKTLDVYGTGFVPGFEVLDVVSKPERTKGGISEWAVDSYAFKSYYAYDGKYLAEFSVRRDGASNFGTNAKYGNFFSLSGGWNIHRESWFNLNTINVLKLRAAYGSTGNRPNTLYPQYDLYSVNTAASYDGVSGMLISQIGNKDLTWEETYTSGLGLDAEAFNNRLRLALDFYIKDTDNILYNVPISGLTGVTNIWQNVGTMQNRGIEINIGGDIVRTNDLTWSLDLNFGHNKNKLTDLYKTRNLDGSYTVKPVIIGDGLGIAGSANRRLEIGYPVDTYYIPEWAGVNAENGLPMWYVVERDDNGNETSRTTTSDYAEATLEKVGKASPDVFGGINTALRWKQFDMNAVFGYSIGGLVYNYSRQEYDSDGTYTDRNQMKLMDGWSRWEKPGDIATHPIARYNNQDKGNAMSSRFLESNDFFRMRSLTLGYNLKLNQYNIDNVRLFASCENLFVWTKYSGVDPEIPVKEDDGTVLSSVGPAVYPMTRKVMFGINVSF